MPKFKTTQSDEAKDLPVEMTDKFMLFKKKLRELGPDGQAI